MSHAHERTEKVCLNCGAQLIGRYCHDCSQENKEPKESVWHFIVHFFNDIIHFEGKFFTTMKLLLRKPGFVAKEFLVGHRVAYVNPIRLYLFMSFAFFLVINYLHYPNEPVLIAYQTDGKDKVHANFTIGGMEEEHMDTALYRELMESLPEEERHPKIQQYVYHNAINMYHYQRNDPEGYKRSIRGFMYSTAPKVIILSLPLFTLGLYVLYWRRRRTYYFVSHGVFAIHYYCVFFVSWIFYYLAVWTRSNMIVGTTLAFCFAFLSVHLFLAMRRFYGQGWWKTFFKYILLWVYTVALAGSLMFLSAVYMFYTLGKDINH